MSDQHHNPEPPADRGPHVEPAPDAAPEVVADELFTHGLLTYLHSDTPARQGERIGRLMAALDSGAGAPVRASETAAPSSFHFPVRSARGWLSLAACITLAAIAVFIGFPGERSAQAEVQQTIAAMRSTAGADRRYEIRLQRPIDDALPSLPGAIIDMRSPSLLLLRANAPDGHEIVAGRDATGDWCIRMDGGLERTHPEQAWPRWSKVGDESLLVDSVDRLLEELTKSYDLQREETGAKLDGSTVSYRHIVGTKKRIRCPGGDHVEVWIDPSTESVERLEMRWDDAPRGPGQPGRAPEGDRAGDHQPDDAPRDHPDRRPPPHRGPPGPDGGPDDQDRPDNFRPAGPPDGEGPGAPDDRRPPHPRFDGHPGGPRGPGFGPGPRGPGPGVGPMRSPPKRLVMQRVDAPAFDAAWFTPEAHTSK